MQKVTLHYLRPPSGLEIYEQVLLLDRPEVKVTLLPRHTRPDVRVDGEVILAEGAPVLWFMFPGEWHDIGRFYRADGTVTGWYANILTPVVFTPELWETTDLFLDLWIPARGPLRVLDLQEFQQAVAEEWLDAETAERAREEMERLKHAHREGTWPPPIVRTFDLDRSAR